MPKSYRLVSASYHLIEHSFCKNDWTSQFRLTVHRHPGAVNQGSSNFIMLDKSTGIETCRELEVAAVMHEEPFQYRIRMHKTG